MSGHSKWATIKRQKGANDAVKGKIFTKLIKEITTAARMGGGDPDANARLRKAIADAKAKQMPADNIKRAVQRGTGELDGANYEEVLYEGTGPGGTLFLVEGMTDNRNRTAPELRRLFEKNGGSLGASGAAGWAFDRSGTISLDKANVSEDRLMEVALEAGAEDYRDDGDAWLVVTPVDALFDVSGALEKAGIASTETRLAYLPKNKKTVTSAEADERSDQSVCSARGGPSKRRSSHSTICTASVDLLIRGSLTQSINKISMASLSSRPRARLALLATMRSTRLLMSLRRPRLMSASPSAVSRAKPIKTGLSEPRMRPRSAKMSGLGTKLRCMPSAERLSFSALVETGR